MATVQLKQGDMFDGPSDLIVLPCSRGGNVTESVRRRLLRHRVPAVPRRLELGEVLVLPFEGEENIAPFVAYAATVARDHSYAAIVARDHSSLDAIRRIGEAVGRETADREAIRRVAAPLLGTGAGGLRADEALAALGDGFRAAAHRDATLVVHVLGVEMYQRLAREGDRSPHPASAAEPPRRVFLSYAHSSPEHKRWVEELGTFLRANGIDARLDAWHLAPGMDLPQFMANEIGMADRVIIVSDETYAEKADGRTGGVGWETMLIQGNMLGAPGGAGKFLVVVRSDDLTQGLPQFLRTKYVLHWPDSTADDRNKTELLKELYSVSKAPPIGPRPVFV